MWRMAVSGLARKFWTMTSWTAPYALIEARSAKIVSARSVNVSPMPTSRPVVKGIGETLQERAESVFALRRVATAYGHVQEVIVQNFRAKPDTAMRHVDDLAVDEYVAAIAVARIVLGPKVRIQAPPNLVDSAECALLLAARG